VNLGRPHGSSSREYSRYPLHPQRVEALDWNNAEQALSERGCAVTAPILSPAECDSLAALFHDASRFRSHIVMERYRFGIGDYKYFANPLPEIITNLRPASIPPRRSRQLLGGG